MQKENAFWREVIDYLPSLVFLFRIDEEENAHLIFCNQKVQEHLGYTAKEYVLAFEENEAIHQEVQELVDQIARRSHDVDSRIQPKPCSLTHKDGGAVNFYFQFRLFKTRSAQTNMLGVELKPEAMIHELMDLPEGKQQTDTDRQSESASFSEKGGEAPFVVESDVMKRLLERMDRIAERPLNVVFQGEPSVGKRTLADRLAGLYSEQLNARVIYFNENMDAGGREAGEQDDEAYTLLRIDHLDHLSGGGQQKLLDWLEGHKEQQLLIVGTAEKPLDAPESGLSSDLFYQLSFYTVPVPPLRHRPEDIKAVAARMLEEASHTLHLDQRPYDESFLEKLTGYQWEQNFEGLFSVLRKQLIKSENGDMWSVLETFDHDSQEDEEMGKEDIISFDEMNRRYLSYVLNMTEGKIYGKDGAADLLGLKPTTLQSKLKKLGIK